MRALFAAALIFVFSPSSVFADEYFECEKWGQLMHAKKRIKHCTAALEAGGLSEYKHIRAYFHRGQAYASKWKKEIKPDYERAIADFTKTIELHPEIAAKNPRAKSLKEGAYSSRAEAYAALRRYDNAIADMEVYLKAVPKASNITWLKRADYYYRARQYKKAIADYTHVLMTGQKDKKTKLPISHSTYQLRGRAYVRLKRYDEAQADLSRCLKLKPNNFKCHFWHGRLNIRLKRYNEAVADFSRCIEFEWQKRDSLCSGNRGWTYHKLGENEKALADLQQALSRRPKWPYALRTIGQVHEAMGQNDKALEAYLKARKYGSKSKIVKAGIARLEAGQTNPVPAAVPKTGGRSDGGKAIADRIQQAIARLEADQAKPVPATVPNTGSASIGGMAEADAQQIRDLIRGLYRKTPDGKLRGKLEPCLLCLSNEQQDTFLSTKLASALGRTQKDRDRIGGCLGYGPLVNGQDHDIKDFKIEEPLIDQSEAFTRASFLNFGKPTSVPFELEKAANGWRITEIGDLGKSLKACR